jgi:hypothetical protein
MSLTANVSPERTPALLPAISRSASIKAPLLVAILLAVIIQSLPVIRVLLELAASLPAASVEEKSDAYVGMHNAKLTFLKAELRCSCCIVLSSFRHDYLCNCAAWRAPFCGFVVQEVQNVFLVRVSPACQVIPVSG